MISRFRLLLRSLSLACAIVGALARAGETNSPLTQQSYVWQRSWDQPVLDSIREHGSNFNELVVLGAEITWRGMQPKVVRVPVNFASLAQAGRPVGLALRIGPFGGPFGTNDAAINFVEVTATSLIALATSNGIKPTELQLDFDCAESKLDGYRAWLEAVRKRVSPLRLTFTALPSWLGQTNFAGLAKAADGYVLQVHSLERPRGVDTPFSLCDPTAARRAVERAGKLDTPFRVALPTYGYLIAFDACGQFIGLSAEGPDKSWPEGTKLREVRANPLELAGLMQFWTTNRPPAMQGIIWYRLPNRADILNWRWPTLAAIMAAHSPREGVRGESRRVERGLVEISLRNDGELDFSSRLAIEARWPELDPVRLVAADSLRGFEISSRGSSRVRFESKPQSWRLPAGESQVVGWLRLSEDREVQVEVKKF